MGIGFCYFGFIFIGGKKGGKIGEIIAEFLSIHCSQGTELIDSYADTWPGHGSQKWGFCSYADSILKPRNLSPSSAD